MLPYAFRCPTRWLLALLLGALCLGAAPAGANAPVASYLFPSGGQRGKTVTLRVGGLFLYSRCGFGLLGPGVEASREVQRASQFWLEAPLLAMPESQRAEDYPQDMAATVRIAADAPLGLRRARLWTAEGAASGPFFEVGDLPEVVEKEIAGDPLPVDVQLPVTINGRIFPRLDIDLWSFTVRGGETITCRVSAATLGSPLDARLMLIDPEGQVVAENDDASGTDPQLSFTARQEGKYQVRIEDASLLGSQAHVYRLTVTTGPALTRVFPLGGRRGTTLQLQLFGPGMPDKPVPVPIPAEASGEYVYRYTPGKYTSRPVSLDMGDYPEYLEPGAVTVPAMLNGVIDRPGAEDSWTFAGKKGESLMLTLRAARLGSPLVGMLTVLDATGKEIGRAEGSAKEIDPALKLRIPADGTYTLKVADRFTSRGGPAFAYRLELGSPSPDFALTLPADTASLTRGGQLKMRIGVERSDGFNAPVTLAIEGLPTGVNPKGALQIKGGQAQANLVLSAEESATLGAAPLRITGTAEVDGKKVTRVARVALLPGQPPCEELLLGVGMAVPFKLISDYKMQWSARGGTLRKHYKIERGDFKGPLVVSLADRQARHLQGVTGPALTIPPDVDEFDYPVQLPPWMETGRTCRVCVMAVGKVRDGDQEHEVGFSATGQNDQMITVVETGRLGLEAGRASVPMRSGEAVTVPVRVARGKGLTGPARVELVLPGHIQGITAEAAMIEPSAEQGQLTIRFAGQPFPGSTLPVILRATIESSTGPVVAEAPLEIVASQP